jgi:lysophospholipase L1-like esterase
VTAQQIAVPPSVPSSVVPSDRPSAAPLALVAAATPPAPPVPVRTLVTLGDSTAVGLGDPVPGGAWRGFPVLLATALGAALVNPSFTGARAADVRRLQLPTALAANPQVAVIVVGMNDTLRSDFDPAGVQADLTATVTALRDAGAHVLLVRYHDHTRVFPLPAPLRRALQRRILALNAAIGAVADTAPERIGVLDLDLMPGGYDREVWAVDRLHPSELGHRMLADGFAALVAGAGFAVPHPVRLECGGGRRVTALHRAAWLVFRGVPWLVRRGRDLGPAIVVGLASELRTPRLTERC